jgi:hypothetical protein
MGSLGNSDTHMVAKKTDKHVDLESFRLLLSHFNYTLDYAVMRKGDACPNKMGLKMGVLLHKKGKFSALNLSF